MIDKDFQFRYGEDFARKQEVLRENGWIRIDTVSFFRTVFDRYGCPFLQERQNVPAEMVIRDGWPCGIAGYRDPFTGKRENVLITRNFEETAVLAGKEYCYTSPLAYFGNRRLASCAVGLFGFTFDIDGNDWKNLGTFLRYLDLTRGGGMLEPSLICLSGTGLHLYYLLDEPVRLNRRTAEDLQYLKRAITTKLWALCSSAESPQYQGIYQGFRVPGSLPKKEYGLGEAVECYAPADNYGNPEVPYHTLRQLNTKEFLEVSGLPEDREPLSEENILFLESQPFTPWEKKMPLAEAKKLYPEWYRTRKEKPEKKTGRRPKRKKAAKTGWKSNEALYRWWISRLLMPRSVRQGHRYHCIAALAVFGVKCGIPFSRVKADALSFFDYFESLTVDPANHFHKTDLEKALNYYHMENAVRMRSRIIAENTGIPIPSKHRHLGLTRTQAAAHARQVRDAKRRGVPWQRGNGRKELKNAVYSWRKSNPDSTKSDCRKELGLSYPTIRKWWDWTPASEYRLKRSRMAREE